MTEKTKQEKEENFTRLAVKRMNKYIKSARLIANLGNKNSYIGTQQQTEKIIKVCEAEIGNIRKAFTTGVIQANGFSF